MTPDRPPAAPDAPPAAPDAPPATPDDHGVPPRFRPTLVRVLLVQIATLALLWLLQAAYHP